MRARGGEAGRRLVTQQNARAWPPRVRSHCFQTARFSRELYGRGGASRLLRDPSRGRPSPRPFGCPVPACLPRLISRVSEPLATYRLSTRSARGGPGRWWDTAACRAGPKGHVWGSFV